jgi:serine/threonine protein kinase
MLLLCPVSLILFLLFPLRFPSFYLLYFSLPFLIFSLSGELNREKLRGTIGYMAPELILTGHCSKATDVFAAGVVLFILLSGRPPFNSKSNREVLEKTAKGQYSMAGAEWDDISNEAKDLVSKMLVVNPENRLSTTDILNHPWIKQLDEIGDDDLSSSSSTSADLLLSPSPPSAQMSSLSLTSNRKNLTSSGVGRKGTGLNLANALRHLSGHVKQLRSEKFATNVTRLVSLMQQSGQNKSTLSNLYLIPLQGKHGGPNMTSPEKAGIADKGSSSGPTTSGENGIKKLSTAAASPMLKSPSSAADEEAETLFLNSEFREGFSSAIRNISDGETGRLSIEQFMAIVKYMSLGNKDGGVGGAAGGSDRINSVGSGGSNVGLGPLIISRFIDRDNDGYITPDDIFAATALIMQRSEIFLKVVFRIYSEAIWYPGRQLNLRSLLSTSTPRTGADTPQTPG